MAGVEISANGTDIATDKKWVTQTVKDTFSAVITQTKTVESNAGATQAEVNAVKTALDAAATAFTAARQDGTSVRATLTNAVTAANSALAGITVKPDATLPSDVPNGQTYILETDRNTYTVAVAAAQAVLDDTTPATVEQISNALTTLATATTAFKAAFKTGTKAVSPNVLMVTPIYEGFEVTLNPALLGGAPSRVMLLCDGVPVMSLGKEFDELSANTRIMLQGPKFNSGSHSFYLQSGSTKTDPVTATAVSTAGEYYFTNINALTMGFDGTTWTVSRNAQPVKNETLLPDANISGRQFKWSDYNWDSGGGYTEVGWKSGSTDIPLTWVADQELLSPFRTGEVSFSYNATYTLTDGTVYCVYAGNTEHRSFDPVPTVTFSGTVSLTINGETYNGAKPYSAYIAIFYDASYDNNHYIGSYQTYNPGNGEWTIKLPRSKSNVEAGKTVHFGVYVNGSSGQRYYPINPGKSQLIASGIYSYSSINLGSGTSISYP
ncbi:MAG: hypothetical protein LBE10_05585 [Treponema sp.]|nr:hypothetical protein [Treponema sp.]